MIELSSHQYNEETGKYRATNSDVYFEPANRAYRGRQDQLNLPRAARSESTLTHFERPIPGYRIGVDPKARRIRIFDPLGEARQDERDEVSAACMAAFKKPFKAAEPRVTENANPATVDHYLTWMFRLVDGHNAELVSGEFPKSIVEAAKAERRADSTFKPAMEPIEMIPA
ncbi:MAG TPA: hypothetical protein VMV69_08810 [Pirellulales bacterium]|nr:hypothetical protein [Pirellulales bacterium]